jgi:hypothetical protein
VAGGGLDYAGLVDGGEGVGGGGGMGGNKVEYWAIIVLTPIICSLQQSAGGGETNTDVETDTDSYTCRYRCGYGYSYRGINRVRYDTRSETDTSQEEM